MKTNWLLIGLLFVVGLFAAAQFGKIALMLGVLAEVYPGRPLPLAVSALSVAGILFGVTAGLVVARIGARKALLGALALGATLSFIQTTLPPFPGFMVLRVLEGFAHLVLVVAAPTLMSAVAAPRDKPVAMGLWGTFFGVGFAVSAAVIPFLGGLRGVFVAHGAGLVMLMVVLWPLLPRGVAAAEAGPGWLLQHIRIYSSPRIVAPALSFIWHTSMFLGLLTFLPGFLGIWTAPLLPLIALIGTFGAGVVARRVPPRTLLLTAFALSIAGLLLVLVLPPVAQLWLILPLFVVLGVVPGASFANVPALNKDPADQARANGAIAQLGNVGTASSTPLFAAAAGAGLPGLMTAAAVVCAIGLGVTWLIHKRIAKSA